MSSREILYYCQVRSVMSNYRGTVVTCLCSSLTAFSRVLRCCGCYDSVDYEIKLSMEETSPSWISTQPRGVHEDEIREMFLHPVQDFIRTIPVYPWTDTQAD
ncbi:hypothetical protein MHYP_G00154660 [Metynnis hypsauchen]